LEPDFYLFFKACGLPYDKNLVFFDSLSKEKAYETTLNILKSRSAPDAIFVAADIAALGVLNAARQLKIKVPEQLGICGFSNEPYTEISVPGITTVDQFSFEMRKKAIELI
jgi:LacI family repressor for deo operon, udp, cdd, tsx, nupC, and nupG